MKKVYVAGAYSGSNVLEVLKNIGRGRYYSAEVFNMGAAPFCPWHDSDYVIRNWDENYTVQQFYDYSIAWLMVSDIMLVIPGWEKSEGTLKEIEIAEKMGIPIVYSLSDLEPLLKLG